MSNADMHRLLMRVNFGDQAVGATGSDLMDCAARTAAPYPHVKLVGMLQLSTKSPRTGLLFRLYGKIRLHLFDRWTSFEAELLPSQYSGGIHAIIYALQIQMLAISAPSSWAPTSTSRAI
ncbi:MULTISPECIES: hypothetical protein [unclassified Mesorhizobium]|uniref:hypothetical protein n=1 Tax=unclassified Mesorhizobium TaxID=325217 RepID=UPI000BAFAD01|nr:MULTISPECIES: hypothetical protein [unclassified Mesorhizobium]MBZ9816226.1 hypothetical protein [Mesorhizobium sp. CA7]PBB18056.1 hypothetical protein CK219_21050 [Mesorhizobium sp. WSM4313]